MQKNMTKALCLLSVCMALNGCGTKGPLYIPERQYPQAQPADPTTQSSPSELAPVKN